MRTNRREFLQATALASLAAVHSPYSAPSVSHTNGISTDEHLNASEIARKQMIVRDTPSSSFFEGMLLGNGDVGACVVVRPDALGIHIGKNDCWDIRVPRVFPKGRELLRRQKVASPVAVWHHLDQLGPHMGRARPTHS